MRQLCIDQAFEQGITLEELQNLESSHQRETPKKVEVNTMTGEKDTEIQNQTTNQSH